jgi:hypothetical protein
MANVVNGVNPLKLDTADANWAAMGLKSPNALFISKIEWYKPASIGDTFSILDAGGNVLVEGTCEVALQSQVYPFQPQRQWSKATGWYLSQISSGTILVYFNQ